MPDKQNGNETKHHNIQRGTEFDSHRLPLSNFIEPWIFLFLSIMEYFYISYYGLKVYIFFF